MADAGLFDSIPWIHPKTTWANVGNSFHGRIIDQGDFEEEKLEVCSICYTDN